MKEQGKLIFSIIILILVVIFSLQNTNVVTLDLFFTKVSIPLVLVILLSLLIGVIIGMLSTYASGAKTRNDKRRLQRRLEEVERDHRFELNEKDNLISELRFERNERELEEQNTQVYSPQEDASLINDEDEPIAANEALIVEETELTEIPEESKGE